ncbi:D-cysteine desulfhydrase family protein [Scleromatobacter humisilvae]|uniref:D-cysteine desulfhydrase family protein n=1 Tax=Scleromatobacter humisilvae TaxID=2897159 RepID=A0A9X2C309_9BURK|nr:D-cysteine desulfhydrase family protein [Scleromatobacter humisilvae]MCK9689431.1 D-cysteine desulfhydrase family protein [Scleromatobacter humisilvae]
MPTPAKLDLTAFPRRQLLDGTTPIQHLPRLSKKLGNVDIFVKRDDVMGLGGGGNKLRKLEFLIGEAQAAGADTIVTVGALQSNHARLTAAAAAKAGLACELVLTRSVPRDDEDFLRNGNVLLDSLLGATVHHIADPADAPAFIQTRIAELRAAGRGVYMAPFGGSSAAGCLGYASCASEIVLQSEEMQIDFDRIVVPNGSGGTQAGLVAGLLAMGRDARLVQSYTVLWPVEKAKTATRGLAQDTLARLSPGRTIADDAVVVVDGQIGEGYGLPTDAMREAVRTVASLEGLLIDPVYGGKAFAGLLKDVREGKFPQAAKLLFVMTGGLPGLFAYRRAF